MFRSEINQFISTCYTLSWIFVGNLVLLNLFLAISLDGFGYKEDIIDDQQGYTEENIVLQIQKENIVAKQEQILKQ